MTTMKSFLIENNFVMYGKCNCGGVYTEKWRNIKKTIHVQYNRSIGKILETGVAVKHDQLKLDILKLIQENEDFEIFEKKKR